MKKEKDGDACQAVGGAEQFVADRLRELQKPSSTEIPRKLRYSEQLDNHTAIVCELERDRRMRAPNTADYREVLTNAAVVFHTLFGDTRWGIDQEFSDVVRYFCEGVVGGALHGKEKVMARAKNVKVFVSCMRWDGV